MDSMRHLSTSLPRTRRSHHPELLSDFKAAALSVTNLYKAAATASADSRAAGYQDAVDDLLTFLDRENLGLMDGEGWRVRQWATERINDGIQRPTSDDEDEATKDDVLETRSSSPEVMKKPAISSTTADANEASSPQRRVASEPPQQQLQTNPALPTTTRAPQSDFTFTASHPYPTNHDRDIGNMELDSSSVTSNPSTPDTIRIFPKPTRNKSGALVRSRADGRSTLNLNLGSVAGSKRKTAYQDFFDISGINFEGPDKRESGGRAGKRGRFT